MLVTINIINIEQIKINVLYKYVIIKTYKNVRMLLLVY